MDIHRLQREPSEFRSALRIDADGRSVALGSVLDQWQADDFAQLDESWKAVCGLPASADVRMRSWLERPRGHSKTSDIAVQVLWCLFASKRAVKGIAAAADRDQAQLLRNAIATLVRENPWLAEFIEVQAWRVVNKRRGSELEIISSDAASSFGHLVDFVVADELCHWQNRDLFDSLLSTAAKRSRCLMLIITNAGFCESWQWSIREMIRQDAGWHFSRLDGPRASWITENRLAEQRRLLPLIAYRRLWLNEWSLGNSGDALNPDDIKSAVTQRGPIHQPERGWLYVGGLDLGISRDKAAFLVLGLHIGFADSVEIPRKLTTREEMLIEAGIMEPPEPTYKETFEAGTLRLKVAHLKTWNPKDTGKVRVEEVEDHIYAAAQRFNLRIGADPWQTSFLCQRLRDRGVNISEIPFVPQTLTAMCSEMLQAFVEHRIDIYNDPELITDLHRLQVKETSYGVRLDAKRGPDGHCDLASALSICLIILKTGGIGLARQFSPAHELIVN